MQEKQGFSQREYKFHPFALQATWIACFDFRETNLLISSFCFQIKLVSVANVTASSSIPPSRILKSQRVFGLQSVFFFREDILAPCPFSFFFFFFCFISFRTVLFSSIIEISLTFPSNYFKADTYEYTYFLSFHPERI